MLGLLSPSSVASASFMDRAKCLLVKSDKKPGQSAQRGWEGHPGREWATRIFLAAHHDSE